MLDHVSIGVSELERSKAFYDAVLNPLGYERVLNSASASGYGDESAKFWILKTEQPVPRDPKSGLHFCFIAPDEESVRNFHAAALANGGEDNGEPGLRPEYATFYYAAFVIDPDGYRLEAFFHIPE